MSLQSKGSSSGKTGNTIHFDVGMTGTYVERVFGFPAEVVELVNDSDANQVLLSWDGATLIHTMDPGEFKDLQAGGRTSIYAKSSSGTDPLRITAT